MRKTLISIVLFIFVMMFATTMVQAATGKDLPNLIYQKGSKYGMNESQKLKIERYIKNHPVTDAEADKIMEKVNGVVEVFESAGVTDVSKLSQTDLKKVQNLATDAATIVGVKLVWNGSSVSVIKDGKVEDVIELDGKLPYTGNETNYAVVIALGAIMVLATGVILRKKFANA